MQDSTLSTVFCLLFTYGYSGKSFEKIIITQVTVNGLGLNNFLC
jgi:hypothetical protein